MASVKSIKKNIIKGAICLLHQQTRKECMLRWMCYTNNPDIHLPISCTLLKVIKENNSSHRHSVDNFFESTVCWRPSSCLIIQTRMCLNIVFEVNKGSVLKDTLICTQLKKNRNSRFNCLHSSWKLKILTSNLLLNMFLS